MTNPKDMVEVTEAERIAPGPWTCFHCGETFATEYCAKRHFGPNEDHEPACRIAQREHGLLGALREAEVEISRLRFEIANEGTESAKAHYAQMTRHFKQLREAEQSGYDKGLADGRRILEQDNADQD